MTKTITPSKVRGSVAAPGSKSHTIRAVLLAALAEGTSRIRQPLESLDTRSCLTAAGALGAGIHEENDGSGTVWVIAGTAGSLQPPENVIDVGNSGTTLYLATGIAALIRDGRAVFTGDAQIRARSAGNLLQALRNLGADAFSTRGNGCSPIVVGGGLSGGGTHVECPTSQYLSSLLLCAPLAEAETTIHIDLLNERPYAEMTLARLDDLGISYSNDDFKTIVIPGGQSYPSFDSTIRGDFSSATFFLCAPAVAGGTLTVTGLDMTDTQGDKAVVGMLEQFGCGVRTAERSVTVTGGPLHGCDLDLNATPDALPALAVVACFAEGTSRLLNVPQAREKETDRISVMCRELSRLGADVEELPDGLMVHGKPKAGGPVLTGGTVCGHSDHRVVMALAVAALGAESPVRIETAESADVTFPRFFQLLNDIRTSS